MPQHAQGPSTTQEDSDSKRLRKMSDQSLDDHLVNKLTKKSLQWPHVTKNIDLL